MKIRKYNKLWYVFFTMLLMLAFSATVSAATAKAKTTVTGGQCCYLKIKDIKGSGVTSHYFKIQPKSGTRYDLIYAYDNSGKTRAGMFWNYGKAFTSPNTNAYIKNKASANAGVILGIRVRSGSVDIQTVCTGSKTKNYIVKDSRSSSRPPLVHTRVQTGHSVAFRMTAGNLAAMPLILSGTKGTSMRRIISSSQNKYAVYTFNASYATVTNYVDGKRSGSQKQMKYYSSFTNSGKKFYCTFLDFAPSGSSFYTGEMQTTRGTMFYITARDYLGMQGTLK
jgi:uncharacterized protein YxeA